MAKGKGSGSGAAGIVSRLKARQSAQSQPPAISSAQRISTGVGRGGDNVPSSSSPGDYIRPEDIKTEPTPPKVPKKVIYEPRPRPRVTYSEEGYLIAINDRPTNYKPTLRERIRENLPEPGVLVAATAAALPVGPSVKAVRGVSSKVYTGLPRFIESRLASKIGPSGVADLAAAGKSVYGLGTTGTTITRAVLGGVGAGTAGYAASSTVKKGFDVGLSRSTNLPTNVIETAQKARIEAEQEATGRSGVGEIARQLPSPVFASENVKRAGSAAFEASLKSQGVSPDTAASAARKQRELRTPYYIAQSVPTVLFSEVPGEVAGRGFLSSTFSKPSTFSNTKTVGRELYKKTFLPFLGAGFVEVQGGIGAAYGEQYSRPTTKSFLLAEGVGLASAAVVTPAVGSQILKYDLLKKYSPSTVGKVSARVKGGLLRTSVEVLEGGQEYLGDKATDVFLKSSSRPKVLSFSFIPSGSSTPKPSLNFGLSTIGLTPVSPIKSPEGGKPRSKGVNPFFTPEPSITPTPIKPGSPIITPFKTPAYIPNETTNQFREEQKIDVNNTMAIFNNSPVPTTVAAGWLPPIPLLFPADSGARGSGKNLPKTLVNELQLGRNILGDLLGGKNFLAGRLKIKKGKRKRSK